MANWTEILLNTLKLTDEVQKLNHLTEKLSDKTIDLDKRLVRLETLIEVAKYQTKAASIGKG
jgi:predicted  nucleic acid-binding Zn-ribbon protein